MRTTRLTPRHLGLLSFMGAWQRLSMTLTAATTRRAAMTLLVMVLTTATANSWSGTGTVDAPYLISSSSELNLLAQRVNSGEGDDDAANGYSGKYFKLVNNINYEYNTEWDANSNESKFVAIGFYADTNNKRYFSGHFDGNGYTISGIRIYPDNNSTDYSQGLFGAIGSGADIHDVNLADTRITGKKETGGIVGYNNGGTVSNCHVAANVAICAVGLNAHYHGGIVGYNYGGTVSNCTSAAQLTKDDYGQYYGGIAGENNYGTLSDNLAISAIVPATANNTFGAITGRNLGTLQRNYYSACQVTSNDINATVKGCGYISNSTDGYTTDDITDTDGAVPALRDNANNSTALGLLTRLASAGHNGTPLDLGWGAGKYPMQLAGRTLSKSGEWNTLCLPFSMDAEQIAASDLAGATIKEMDCSATGTELNDHIMTLKFTAATSIVAGKPYIVKWMGTSGSVSNPIFSDVTVNSTEPTAVKSNDMKVTFVGQYSPFSIGDTNSGTFDGDINEIIMLSTNNRLGYSQNPRSLRSFRCHFYVRADGGVQAARSFVIDFGGETTEIISPAEMAERAEMAGAWYDLSGRRISVPSTSSVNSALPKGVYIRNGRKIVIK